MEQTIEQAQTAKRDYFRRLERRYQQRWQNERIFEVNAPPQSELVGLSQAEICKKYLNGGLHLGHAFTISKVEFAAGYERLLSKRVLSPHGFHVTGLSIKVLPRRFNLHLS